MENLITNPEQEIITVREINYPIDLAMKTIISLGAGSKNILEMYNVENK